VAIEAVGRAWRKRAGSITLPALDWNAILRFLAAVHAV
jgi:hypothetical protein